MYFVNDEDEREGELTDEIGNKEEYILVCTGSDWLW